MARVLFCLLALAGPVSGADEPLHVRIDRAVEGSQVGEPAPLAGDAEFLRRITLDLTGAVPSLDGVRAFLADASPDKRAAEIDRLLSSREFARHMARVMDVALMERQADKHVKTPEWQEYLFESILANKAYDQLAREILGADGVDEGSRPAARFYLDREGETNRLTRDVGRMFFGKDYQCAQCHDHPLINDYLQADYYGLFAFLNRSFIYTDAKKKVSTFAEKGEGDVTFKSVFTGEGGETGPRLPGGEAIDEPVFAKGEEYDVKPAKDVRPVPKYSRRSRLAELATDGDNRAFNENIANRLWAHLMGRGLVEPVDLHSSDNPPSHPELLEMLGREMSASGFDMQAMIRELALTRTYQRQLDMPAEVAAASGRALARELTVLEAAVTECEARKTAADAAKDEASERFESARDALGPVAEALDAAGTSLEEAAKKHAEAHAAAQGARTELAGRSDALAAVDKAAVAAREAAAVLAGEKQLAEAAEQFASRAEGLTQEVAELEKKVAALAGPESARQAEHDAAAAAHRSAAAAHEAASGALAEARARRDTCLAELDAARRRLADARESVEVAGQLARLAEAFEQARAARGAAETAAGELAAARSELARLAAELPRQKSELGAAEAAHGQAQTTAEATAADLEKRRQAAELMADVAAKSQAASEKLPDDKKLAETTEGLKARSAALAGELAAVQKTMTEHAAAVETATTRVAAARKVVADATGRAAEVQESADTLAARVGPLVEQAQARETQVAELADQLLPGWIERFAVTTLKPLTPEQLAWSMMEITGVVERQRAASAAELEKKTPLGEGAADEALAARDREVERAVADKLKGNVDQFVRLFGHAAGQPQTEFFATADQALFFANGGQLQGWLTASNGNLMERLVKINDPAELAESLYLGVLTRPPDAEETHDVARLLGARPDDKTAVVRDLMWSLLTSVEFRFNH